MPTHDEMKIKCYDDRKMPERKIWRVGILQTSSCSFETKRSQVQITPVYQISIRKNELCNFPKRC